MQYLNREQTSLPEGIWDRINATAAQTARDLLIARRFLDLKGPYGMGLITVSLSLTVMPSLGRCLASVSMG